MNRSPTPLIARLRRRLVASVWLFALLVLAKSAVATACMTDDLATTEKASVTVSDRAADTAVTSPAVDDTASESCLDAGGSDCHCACAHAFAMSLAYPGWSIDATATPHDASRVQRHAAAPRSTTLRPPISC
jgi:hypothetical protein